MYHGKARIILTRIIGIGCDKVIVLQSASDDLVFMQLNRESLSCDVYLTVEPSATVNTWSEIV